jgi:two-component system, NarL family, response regulator NreC
MQGPNHTTPPPPSTPPASPSGPLAEIAAQIAAAPYARRGVAVSDETIRVLLVDDHRLVRAGLRALLRTAPDVSVVGEAESGPEAVAEAARLRPNVVVMDLDMPGGDGAAATRELAAREPASHVLVLTQHAEEEQLVALLDAGAGGYLAKDAAERELVDAIRVVARGEVYVRPRVARMLASSVRHRDEPTDGAWKRFAALSDREQTVCRRVAEGYNGREIGRQLGISAKTVDTYRQRIEEKLGIAHRTDYVRFALELGLLHAPGEEPARPAATSARLTAAC